MTTNGVRMRRAIELGYQVPARTRPYHMARGLRHFAVKGPKCQAKNGFEGVCDLFDIDLATCCSDCFDIGADWGQADTTQYGYHAARYKNQIAKLDLLLDRLSEKLPLSEIVSGLAAVDRTRDVVLSYTVQGDEPIRDQVVARAGQVTNDLRSQLASDTVRKKIAVHAGLVALRGQAVKDAFRILGTGGDRDRETVRKVGSTAFGVWRKRQEKSQTVDMSDILTALNKQKINPGPDMVDDINLLLADWDTQLVNLVDSDRTLVAVNTSIHSYSGLEEVGLRAALAYEIHRQGSRIVAEVPDPVVDVMFAGAFYKRLHVLGRASAADTDAVYDTFLALWSEAERRQSLQEILGLVRAIGL